MMIYNKSDFAYNFTKEIIENFINEKHELILVFPDDEYKEEFIAMGCKIIKNKIDRRGTNIFKDFMLYRNYKKILKTIKPDVVFGFTIKPNIYGAEAAKRYKIPFIARISGLGSAFQSKNIMFFLTRYLYKKSFSKIAYIFFENQNNYEVFNQKIKNYSNSKVIPGSGVNIKEFNYQEYPDENNPVKFLFVGRIMFEKGIEEYLYAASKLREKYGSQIEFHIVGRYEENYYDEIKQMEKKEMVIYHGTVKNIKKIIKESNCIVLPSHHEGLSNALLEALSSGRPVIGSDIPGIRETFQNKVSGLTFELGNKQDLINKIEEFYNLPYSIKESMGRNGRKYVKEHFDRSIVVKEYMAQLDKVSGGKKNG